MYLTDRFRLVNILTPIVWLRAISSLLPVPHAKFVALIFSVLAYTDKIGFT